MVSFEDAPSSDAMFKDEGVVWVAWVFVVEDVFDVPDVFFYPAEIVDLRNDCKNFNAFKSISNGIGERIRGEPEAWPAFKARISTLSVVHFSKERRALT